MKNTRGGSVPTRVSTATALFAVALTIGCDRKAGSSNTQSPPKASAVVSAEKTSFHEVAARLDAGGSLYGYLGTAQWLEGLSGKIDGAQRGLLQSGLVPPGERAQVETAFKAFSGALSRSGLEGVTGVGISGIALEPGFYQTKVFVHRAPGAEEGYLRSLTGGKARPLTELDWMPAETALALFGDFDLGGAWSALNRELTALGIPEAMEGLEALETQVEKTTGKTLRELLGSLGGQQGLLLTLDPARKVSLPLPDMDAPVEFPEPGLLLAVAVKDDTLFDLIDEALKQLPNVATADEDGLRMRSMAVPLPLPMKLQPTVARWENLILIGTSEDLVRKVVAVKGGTAPGLKADPEFQRVSQGLALEGNQFSYVSKAFGQVFVDIQAKMMAAQQEKDPQAKAVMDLMQSVFGEQKAASAFAVGGLVPDGWLMTARGGQNPSAVALLPAAAFSGLMAAVAVPNFVKARSTAQSNGCMNNLRQVCLAARLYADEHNNRLPSGLDEYEPYLADVEILVCPEQKGSGVPTYKLVKRGGLITGPSAGTTVLVECPVHGHKGFVDGRVEQAAKR
jgi:hypothetical protein